MRTLADFEQDVLTADEAREVLRMSRDRFYALVRRGDLPAFQAVRGGKWLVSRVALEEWLRTAGQQRVAVESTRPTRPAVHAPASVAPSGVTFLGTRGRKARKAVAR